MAKAQKIFSKSQVLWWFIVIFVTLGNDKHKFTRLLNQIVSLSKDVPSYKFMVQSGHTDFQETGNIKFQSFFDKDTFYKNIKEASLVISHAGAGTLIKLIQSNKKPIVVPRLFKFNEHLNDHQLEIANEFRKKDLCYLVNNIEDLSIELIDKSINQKSISKNKKNLELFENISNDFKRLLA